MRRPHAAAAAASLSPRSDDAKEHATAAPALGVTGGLPAATSALTQAFRVELAVLVAICVVIIHFELLAVHSAVTACQFPDSLESGAGLASRALLVGDPQLTDDLSYSFLAGDTLFYSLLRKVVIMYSDIYLRRAYTLFLAVQRTDAVVFVGDMLDSTRTLSPAQYQESVRRLYRVFSLHRRPDERFLRHTRLQIPVFGCAGNHDVGYGIAPEDKQAFAEQFERDFFPLFYSAVVARAEWVFVSATDLPPFQTSDSVRNRSETFFNSLSQTPAKADVRILVSHVPLFRVDSCGNERSSETSIITAGGANGRSYTTMLEQSQSDDLLERVNPAFVFSGDDHDNCIVQHRSGKKIIMEHTVGTSSFLQGNLQPSFSLFSLWKRCRWNSKRERVECVPIVASSVCQLPSQFEAFALELALCSLLLALNMALNWRNNNVSHVQRTLVLAVIAGLVHLSVVTMWL